LRFWDLAFVVITSFDFCDSQGREESLVNNEVTDASFLSMTFWELSFDFLGFGFCDSEGREESLVNNEVTDASFLSMTFWELIFNFLGVEF
jgi:hypothetical protein